MAVLIECINVIVRKSTLHEKYPGGVSQYEKDCPNPTFCADDHIARVGFMAPDDVGVFVEHLKRMGFIDLQQRKFCEIAIVDQNVGPTAPCDWLGFLSMLRQDLYGAQFCLLAGSNDMTLAVPEGWIYETSMTLQGSLTKTEDMLQLDFIRHDRGVDVYRDCITGKEKYVRRTSTYKRLFEANPDDVFAASEYMRECLEFGDASKALEISHHILKHHPNDTGRISDQGLALFLSGRLQEAQQRCEQALKMDPDDPIIRRLLARIARVMAGEIPQPRRIQDLNAVAMHRRCPYCRSQLKAGDMMSICRHCRTAYHHECWAERGCCGVHGCVSKDAIRTPFR